MSANSLLTIKAPETLEKFSKLLQRIDSDSSLRQLYVRDPAGTIMKTVFSETDVPSAEINRGNRLLFALLTNRAFMNWLGDYQSKLERDAVQATQINDPEDALRTYLAVIDRATIHSDLVEAVAQHADAELIAGMSWRPDRRAGIPSDPVELDIAVEIETFIYAVAAAAVFAVAIPTVFLGAVPDIGIDRRTLQNVANRVSDELNRHANDVRQRGVLLDANRRNLGFMR